MARLRGRIGNCRKSRLEQERTLNETSKGGDAPVSEKARHVEDHLVGRPVDFGFKPPGAASFNRALRVFQGGQDQRGEQTCRATQERGNGERIRIGVRITGHALEWREVRHEFLPLSLWSVFREADIRCGLERVGPGSERAGAWVPVQLFVTVADQTEGIVVVAHPQMQTVFFNSPRWPTARRTFTAQGASPAGRR